MLNLYSERNLVGFERTYFFMFNQNATTRYKITGDPKVIKEA